MVGVSGNITPFATCMNRDSVGSFNYLSLFRYTFAVYVVSAGD